MAIKKWNSMETGSIGYTRRGKTKQKHNTIFVGHHYAQTNTNIMIIMHRLENTMEYFDRMLSLE